MGKGGGSNFSGAKQLPPEQLGQSTPNLFKPYQQYMPQEYFGAGPVNDPTAILNAYMQNMPEFLKASRSENTFVAPPAVAASSGSSGGIAGKAFAPHEKLAKAFIKPFKKLF